MTAQVVRFPTDVTGMLEALTRMIDDGTVREFIVFAPNAADTALYHFRASDGIKLSDVLMARQLLARIADKLTD